MNASTALASATGQVTGNDVGVSVLKKAMEVEAQNAVQLINAIPKPEKTTANLPSNLGQNVNTTA
ncbi:MAG: YjfB family protein [Sulfuricella denitrificans]|nr:YjfB family protein [Sulfuricella denitrificans]